MGRRTEPAVLFSVDASICVSFDIILNAITYRKSGRMQRLWSNNLNRNN